MAAKKEKNFLILPACDDTNRGDQALIWETVRMAKEAGFQGHYNMLAEEEKSLQSRQEQIGHLDEILPHPSVYFKNKNNVRYDKGLKIKWALVSLRDGFVALSLLLRPTRAIMRRLISQRRRNSLEAFENADAAFVKGGGFLHSYGGIVNTYANFYDLYHILLALSLKKPVYVMPNSFGPFLSPGTKWMIRRALSRCRLVTVRETLSQESVRRELGIETTFLPDLAFFLEAQQNFTQQQLETLHQIPFDRKCVALTVRPYRFTGAADPAGLYEAYQNSICSFVEYLSTRGYCPVLVEHTFSGNQHEQDMSCIQDIAKKLSCEYFVYSDLSLNCRQLKYVYSKFQYVVGTRFHSVIFSIAAKVPSIAITYGGNKGQGIMKDLQLSEFAIPMEDISFDCLRERFELLENSRELVCERIQAYMDRAALIKQEVTAGLREK